MTLATPGAITLPTLAIYDGAPVTYADGRLMVDGAVVRAEAMGATKQ